MGIKRWATSMAATAAMCAGVIVFAAPQAADATGVCISRAEFRQIHNGQTLRRVKNIIGGAPKALTPQQGNTLYGDWKKCSDGISTIVFDSGSKRVLDKVW